MKILNRILAAGLFLSCLPTALAHKPSDSYLNVRMEDGYLEGDWEIAVKDIEYAIGLDANGDGEITWGEIKNRFAEIDAYALVHLKLNDGDSPLAIRERLIEKHSDGAYLVLRFTGPAKADEYRLKIHYDLLFDLDPQHRGLLKASGGGVVEAFIFSPGARDFVFQPGTRPSHSTARFVREGVHHIWFGFDHILFLLALLLPVVTSGNGESFRAIFFKVLKIVTAFTVAHSVTLSVAVLGWLNPPSRWVESAIAFSVILAAVNNLLPFFGERSWMVAFGFGLVHGFGFASALRDTGLAMANLAFPLFGFNAGVELGQMAIVALFLPLAFSARQTWFYQRVSVRFGSGCIALIAAAWMTERLFSMKLMPF